MRRSVLAALLSLTLPSLALAQANPAPAPEPTSAPAASPAPAPAPAPAVAPPQAAAPSSAAPSKVTVDAGGWLLLNASRNFGRLNATDLPLFATAAGGEANAGLNVRQSRVRFNVGIPTDGLIAGSVMKGLVELDFMGPGVNADPSLPLVRLRHAWVAVSWKEKANLTLMAGQNWNLFFGPLVPVSLGHLAVPRFGGAGFLFRRAPQLRVSAEVGAPLVLSCAVAALSPMDRQTTQGGILVGERSGSPEGEARVAASYRPGGKTAFELGLSGRYAIHRWLLDGATPARDEDVDSWGGAADLKLDLGFALLQGAGFVGEAMGAYASIAPGERLTTTGTPAVTTAVDAVRTQGGWAQLVLTPVKGFQLALGGGLEKPRRGDLPAGTAAAPTVSRNRQLSGAAIVNLSSRWRVSVEGTGYWTDFVNGTERTGQQVELASLVAF
jgi:hypothetical protein